MVANELESVVNELVCCAGSFVVNELEFVVNELAEHRPTDWKDFVLSCLERIPRKSAARLRRLPGKRGVQLSSFIFHAHTHTNKQTLYTFKSISPFSLALGPSPRPVISLSTCSMN